jgi:hypothetical protein
VKFVVAVDELSPTMDRQIRFLAEHSSFDVQCVALAKSREPSGDIYYMPTLIPADRVPAPRSIRLVGSAAPASHRRASASYEVMRREGALPFDLERVQWDG